MKNAKRFAAALLIVVLAAGLLSGCQDTLAQAVRKVLGTGSQTEEEDTTRWAEATTDPLMIEGIADPSAKYDSAITNGRLNVVFNGIWSRKTSYFTRKLQNHWIIEMGEMKATITAKNIEQIKSFLSRQKETYKVPYEVHPEDRPRQCVFCGTSNDLNFLPLDRTGNRRFAPVMTDMSKAEVHILDNETESKAYIEQAWAEAMVLYRQGNVFLGFTKEIEEEAKRLQKEFMPEDTNAGIIQAFLDDYGISNSCNVLSE